MPAAPTEAIERARRVRLMLFDVDGVLTDGRLWYSAQGEALKAFSARDGHGMKLLAAAGVRLALLSGRSSPAVALRAAELGIDLVLQGIADKRAAFDALLAQLALEPAAAGFMGDELVDLPVLRRCGFACAPGEAPELVRQHAHYVARAAAGGGAVREVCEFVLRAQGRLDGALEAYLQ
ncbi:MAG: phenylphosphate carboxylase subunit delta [Betaproteobacteria bacterium]|nr:MAG: phenylphosphate carboxylase subunit delta [Betaproteobacteria bacterium]